MGVGGDTQELQKALKMAHGTMFFIGGNHAQKTQAFQRGATKVLDGHVSAPFSALFC